MCFQGPKNFIITLKNPSLGAKIGNRSAIVCNITKGKRTRKLQKSLERNVLVIGAILSHILSETPGMKQKIIFKHLTVLKSKMTGYFPHGRPASLAYFK